MAHARQQIRDAVETALTGIAAVGDRIYVGRTRALAKDHQPTILIYSPTEQSQRETSGSPPRLVRALQVFVEIRITSASIPDDALDDIAIEVERRMWDDVPLDTLLRNKQLVSTEILIEAQGDMHVGGARLEYRLTYVAPEGSPSTVIP